MRDLRAKQIEIVDGISRGGQKHYGALRVPKFVFRNHS